MWTGINLQEQVTPQVTAIIPLQPIILNLYSGQTNDASGAVTTSYTTFATFAQMQLTKQQDLEEFDAFNISKIYKDFRIQSYNLTGLNRNLSTGGDYIEWNGLYYRIVALPENFLSGWVYCIGEESTSIPGA